jgi:ubiquinone/menaquinone biosynthesis C-methylase UbiE
MARARVDAAARKAGALVEFEEAPPMRLTAAADSIDIVVLMMGFGRRPSAERPGPIGEALRVLRPGGRVVIVEGAKTGGMLRALQEKPPRLDASEMLALLDVAGFRARRQLADVDGVAFYEARKT